MLCPASSMASARSARVVIRMGSTEWIRKGSIIVVQRSMAGEDTPRRWEPRGRGGVVGP